MRKLVFSGLFVIAIAGIAYAVDIDRHASYTDGKAAGKELCKPFYGADDNRTQCSDWCSQWTAENQGTTCACADGRCAADDTQH